MIIIKLSGGLGNQMFQYALGRHLAYKRECTLKLDITSYPDIVGRKFCIDNFKIQGNIIPDINLAAIKILTQHNLFGKIMRSIPAIKNLSIHVVREKTKKYDPNLLKTDGSLYVIGYWQSEKYFLEIRDIILKEFVPNSSLTPMNQALFDQILSTEAVSLHIRRGDYISNPRTREFHGELPIEYYRSAIQYILDRKPNVHIFVFSDDIFWSKAHLDISNQVTWVPKGPEERDYEHLFLMTKCKHNIIANSSFSWWGAWLSRNPDKIVIAPRTWFRKKLYSEDIVPASWVRL